MSNAQAVIDRIEASAEAMPLEIVLSYIDALEQVGQYQRSWDALRSLYDVEPCEPIAVRLIAMMCRLGFRDADIVSRMIASHPDSEIIRAGRAELALVDGDYDEGFKSCDYRWSVAKGERIRSICKGKDWDGSPVEDLVVIGEQGIGEEYLFASAFADIQPATVGCDNRLVPLLSRSFPKHRFVDKTTLPSLTTEHSSLVEAMALYRGRTGNQRPWLIADIGKAAYLRACFQREFPGKTLVGISWSSWRANLSESKSIPQADLIPLLSDPSIVAVNLQYGDPRDDISEWEKAGIKVYGWDTIDVTNDQDGLAALITAMDCVVTCSNSVAHLSGALGQRTILMAPGQRFVLWYWGKDGNRTPWYPTVEIVRGPPRMAWSQAAEVALGLVKHPISQEC